MNLWRVYWVQVGIFQHAQLEPDSGLFVAHIQWCWPSGQADSERTTGNSGAENVQNRHFCSLNCTSCYLSLIAHVHSHITQHTHTNRATQCKLSTTYFFTLSHVPLSEWETVRCRQGPFFSLPVVRAGIYFRSSLEEGHCFRWIWSIWSIRGPHPCSTLKKWPIHLELSGCIMAFRMCSCLLLLKLDHKNTSALGLITSETKTFVKSSWVRGVSGMATHIQDINVQALGISCKFGS